ncbi:RNase adapter RapZ [Gordonibacter sp. Marseille-P4307]|uniref:RNase adapter RapZ n=1 Tax=Gordonibacter sp. Marseille-P4307 TaxID=2161815 RepID=UPI000F52B429|nr:RNase adapter RapZ [Gordonibacter sp. Marseille-P4307]
MGDRDVALENLEVVIVSGMSGAGRTESMRVFEDLGYYCVDNLPPVLIGNLIDMYRAHGIEGKPGKLAFVCDARTGDFFEAMHTELESLKGKGVNYRIVFLDAEDEKLISRYKSSRRRHPLCGDGATISRGIERERDVLFELKQAATFVIDTTNLLPAELRAKIRELFSDGSPAQGLSVTVYSFGFKHGAPADADVVIDVRFLPNPYYESRLKYLTGLDQPVRDYVLYNEETEKFLRRWEALLDCVMPGYVSEGKQQLAIAVGCTGGQHRSVALAEVTGDYLSSKGYRVSVAHRDLKLAVRRDGSVTVADVSASAND